MRNNRNGLRRREHAYDPNTSKQLAMGMPFKHSTCFDGISANVSDAGINLLGHKFGGCLMDRFDAKCILSSQGRCRSHSIAAVSCKDLLVGLQATVLRCLAEFFGWSLDVTYAPPELSDPAITKTRFMGKGQMNFGCRWKTCLQDQVLS
jgi:hypothetical protein